MAARRIAARSRPCPYDACVQRQASAVFGVDGGFCPCTAGGNGVAGSEGHVVFAAAAVAWPAAKRNAIRTYALPRQPDGTPLLTYDQLRAGEPWPVPRSYHAAPYWGWPA
jgi:hypothetical protein